MAKLEDLVNWFEDKDKVLVALSGGVDSALYCICSISKIRKFGFCSNC